MTQASAPFRATQFPSAAMHIERRIDGTLIVTPKLPLAPYVWNLPAELARRAALHPEHIYLAERQDGPSSPWYRASYAEVNARVRAVASWLLRQRFGGERTLLILSGNSIHHAVFKYGAMAARVVACPVSPNYGLMGGDFSRLKHVISLIRPAVVFCERSASFKQALESVDFGDATIITDSPAQLSRIVGNGEVIAIAEVLATSIEDSVDESVAALDPDATALLMLTSGSTSLPKAVMQTLRMLGSNIGQGRQVLGETAGWGHVMVDWLPWSHVSGAVTKMGVLVSGGTLYIDGGKPAPGLFEHSLRNIAEVMPQFYINVPFGYAMLVEALEEDAQLRERFFRNLRLALYGGAGLPQALYDRFQALAVATVGERIFFTTGYGATETAAGCMSIYFPTEQVGIGLPMPGLTLKLVPNTDRFEVRLKGPMITSGYLGQGDRNRELFDDEGFYRTGDAAQWHDPDDETQGLKFAGRLTEEFKLANGTWVKAGHLRAVLLEILAPLVSDLLLCGENRTHLALLLWAKAPVPDALEMEISRRLEKFNAGRGSSEYIAAFALLAEPPRSDAHEVSDKGTINQRVALARRSVDVERLYAPGPQKEIVILPRIS